MPAPRALRVLPPRRLTGMAIRDARAEQDWPARRERPSAGMRTGVPSDVGA
jgi:hypothetical protein